MRTVRLDLYMRSATLTAQANDGRVDAAAARQLPAPADAKSLDQSDYVSRIMRRRLTNQNRDLGQNRFIFWLERVLSR